MRDKRVMLLAILVLGSAVGIGSATVVNALHAKFEQIKSAPDTACRLEFSNGSVIEHVPVASTFNQMSVGLSGQVDPGPGLLFVWPDEQVRRFWMLRTPAELSVLFLSPAGEITQIIDMEPNTTTIHKSADRISKALEVPKASVKALSLDVGGRVYITQCEQID